MDRGSDEWLGRLDRFLSETVAPVVLERGWAVQSVMGGGETVYGFQYTIGLTAKRMPELLVTDFCSDLGMYVLNALAADLIDAGPGDVVGRTVKVGLAPDADEVVFGFRAPRAGDRETPLGMASHFYRRQVEHVVVTTAGWPCPRCAFRRLGEGCTCEFNCWHLKCALLASQVRPARRLIGRVWDEW